MPTILACPRRRETGLPLLERIRAAVRRPAALFFLLLLLGFGLRLGYGIVRYRSDLLRLSGPEFIAKWDFDALEHVLIAHALVTGKGYVVDDVPGLEGKHVRAVGQEALFKAPLYEFFLAGVFAVSGFSFALFFPIQSLLGGILSGFVGLLALKTWERPAAAWIAGVAAAVHPVLVNSASQPYNENLFFLLFVAAVWTFGRWLDTRLRRWAIACGVVAALWILARESAAPPFAAMVIFGAVTGWREPRRLGGLGVIVLVAAALIAPWSVRNYVRMGDVVPVASIVGSSLLQGNNECVARESVLTPFWGEGPCRATDAKRAALLARLKPTVAATVVSQDRVAGQVALDFILNNPAAYLKLCVRRLWTGLLPYNPRADQKFIQRTAFTIFWLAIVPVGLLGTALHLVLMPRRAVLLALLTAVNLAALVAVLITPDQRYRAGIDLLLGCFAAWGYDRWFRRSSDDQTESMPWLSAGRPSGVDG